MVSINSTFTRKVQGYHDHGPPTLQNAVNGIQTIAIFIIQKEFYQTLMKEFL